MKIEPIDLSLLDLTEVSARDRIYRQWAKARDRLDRDPEGAVTAARSLLESVCKYVLEVLGGEYGPHLDLNQLFRLAAAELKFNPSGEAARIEQQFYGGTKQIIQSLVELRNLAGDAHGKGLQGIRASAAQAELAVNVAGSTSAFLLRKLDGHLAATRRLNSRGHAILRFDKSTVWRLVDHCQNAPSHMPVLRERKPKASIWLVADAGIYLMSNGKPPLLESGRLETSTTPAHSPRLVAHAEGCGPTDSVDDWMPLQLAMSGGDDFVERLSIRDVRLALEGSSSQIVVVSNTTHYAVYSDRDFDDVSDESAL